MTPNPNLQHAVEELIQALAPDDTARAPLDAEATYDGPLQAEPIRGEAAVREHLAAIAPFLSRVELKRALYDGDSAALVLEIEGVNGVIIEGAEFLRIEDGRIRDIRVYFDTGPLLRGSPRRG